MTTIKIRSVSPPSRTKHHRSTFNLSRNSMNNSNNGGGLSLVLNRGHQKGTDTKQKSCENLKGDLRYKKSTTEIVFSRSRQGCVQVLNNPFVNQDMPKPDSFNSSAPFQSFDQSMKQGNPYLSVEGRYTKSANGRREQSRFADRRRVSVLLNRVNMNDIRQWDTKGDSRQGNSSEFGETMRSIPLN